MEIANESRTLKQLQGKSLKTQEKSSKTQGESSKTQGHLVNTCDFDAKITSNRGSMAYVAPDNCRKKSLG